MQSRCGKTVGPDACPVCSHGTLIYRLVLVKRIPINSTGMTTIAACQTVVKALPMPSFLLGISIVPVAGAGGAS